ncbi:MAG: OmpA family protein [Cyanobacteria bacterium J06632_22]
MTYQPSPLTSADTAGGKLDSLRLPNLRPNAPVKSSPADATSAAAPTESAPMPHRQAAEPTTVQPQHRPNVALTIVTRLLLLGVGLPTAWLLGIGAAQVLGHRSNQIPLQETALRRANRVVREVRYLPDRWRQPDRSITRVEPVPIPAAPIEPLSQPTEALSTSERQVALEEVDAIATELRSLNRRLIDLETRLGRAQSTADLQSRLTAIRTSLATTADRPTETPVPPISPVIPVDEPNPLLDITELQVTLPSDALFVPGEARLLETAPTILSTILSDLNRYPNATILIGSHTDDRSDATISRELAFRQANVLQAYLTNSLGAANSENGQRWVTIGYGQSQPLSNNETPEARQRNRRVEISVDRR